MNDARLLVRLPDGTSNEVVLHPSTSLGRQPGNVVLLPDPQVSKQHALIEWRADGWFFRDLGSSNGSLVNGQPTDGCRLGPGDEIRLGASTLLFRGPGPASGVTLFESALDPAILTALPGAEAAGFRPASQIEDPALLRRDYEKLRVTMEFGRLIVLERDVDALLERILAFAFEVLPAERGAIFLVGEGGGLEARAVRHRQGEGELHLSASLLARVQLARESVLVLDAGTDTRFASSHSLLSQGVRSAMAVPLLVGEEVRGVLFLDTRQQVAAFSEKDLQLLSGIAAQAALALERTALGKQIEREAETRAHLARFLAPALVEQARTGQIELQRGGQLTTTTVLFSDIRAFTALSARVGPEETVRMLNEYFERMVDCVFRHGGVLDKFIGDALMALWGAPLRRPDDVDRAVACALEMQRELAALNRQRQAAGREPIEIGIGINAGPAVVGNMGSSKRLEYTAIGDAVNLASRLCHLAGAGEVLVAAAALEQAAGPVAAEPLPPARVKGKEAPVAVVRLLG